MKLSHIIPLINSVHDESGNKLTFWHVKFYRFMPESFNGLAISFSAGFLFYVTVIGTLSFQIL